MFEIEVDVCFMRECLCVIVCICLFICISLVRKLEINKMGE